MSPTEKDCELLTFKWHVQVRVFGFRKAKRLKAFNLKHGFFNVAACELLEQQINPTNYTFFQPFSSRFPFTTECFTDLDKLNLPMVVQF